jgi:molybdenum cofactor cytidylyltransferase
MIYPLAVLAAGRSARLGSPKQLVPFEGKTLLRRVVETALFVAVPGIDTPVGVVLGAEAAACQGEISGLAAHVLVNEAWTEGLASSVRLAVAWALEQRADALVLLLCDQPFVSTELLQHLIATHRATGQPLVACAYENGATGAPLLVEKRFFGELLALEGDRGAQGLLRRYPDAVATVPFPLGTFDVDTPEDLAKLSSRPF